MYSKFLAHWLGCWVSPRAGLDAAEKKKTLPQWNLTLILPTQINILRTTYSQLLHQLSYLGSLLK
jgi:hypothetical protein